jgi:hypothetical protein
LFDEVPRQDEQHCYEAGVLKALHPEARSVTFRWLTSYALTVARSTAMREDLIYGHSVHSVVAVPDCHARVLLTARC